MDKIEKIRQEIERRREANKRQYLSSSGDMSWQRMCSEEDCLIELLAFIDTLSEEPDKSLDEAAEKKYPVYWKDYPKDGIARSELSYDTNKQCREAFKAGAEWQKEQDVRDMIMSDGSYFQKCYELGKKDAEREINKELIKAMEKVHEIRDVDYDIHIDTSTDGSFETISYYENGKLVGQEQSKKTE